MTSQTIHEVSAEQSEADFMLSTAQMEFMLNIDAAAAQADRDDDYDFFDTLVASDEWIARFGSMRWDQAYDRYEIMLGRCTDC